jgi:uncharacterized protein YggE
MPANRALAALALAGVVLLAGCVGGIGSTAPANDDPAAVGDAAGDDGTTVAVAGQATVEAEPDAATVSLSVQAQGDDAATVRDRLAENVSDVRAALADLGLDDEQVTTDHFRVRQTRPHERERGDAPDYVGVHALTVELDDVDAVGDVVDAAVGAGATDVDHVTFRLSDERRAELRDEALTDAMGDARDEAELLAAAEGLTLANAASISTDEVSVDRPTREVAYADAAATPAPGGASTSVAPGDVTVRVSVQVVYNATTGGSDA